MFALGGEYISQVTFLYHVHEIQEMFAIIELTTRCRSVCLKYKVKIYFHIFTECDYRRVLD
jgi:hypothetical protein